MVRGPVDGGLRRRGPWGVCEGTAAARPGRRKTAGAEGWAFSRPALRSPAVPPSIPFYHVVEKETSRPKDAYLPTESLISMSFSPEIVWSSSLILS